MKFLDRESELSALMNLWRGSISGKFNFVVIYGRRGVGKTRLVFEFCRINNVPLAYIFVERKNIEL